MKIVSLILGVSVNDNGLSIFHSIFISSIESRKKVWAFIAIRHLTIDCFSSMKLEQLISINNLRRLILISVKEKANNGKLFTT